MFPQDGCVSLKPTAQWEEKALPAAARALISTSNGNMAAAYVSYRLTRVQSCGPGVLEAPQKERWGPSL